MDGWGKTVLKDDRSCLLQKEISTQYFVIVIQSFDIYLKICKIDDGQIDRQTVINLTLVDDDVTRVHSARLFCSAEDSSATGGLRHMYAYHCDDQGICTHIIMMTKMSSAVEQMWIDLDKIVVFYVATFLPL